MTQSASWYHPAQIVLALGVTLPLFLYYGYRIYNLVLDHRSALRRFLDAGARARLVREALPEKPPAAPAGDLAVQLALAEVFAEFDRDLGSRRRALRTDSQAVVLVGFIGTLIGVSGAFASLASHGGSSDRGGALGLLEQLVGGGLATALVSSLVAALLGVLALGYLSATERSVVTARKQLLAACRAGLRSTGLSGSPDSPAPPDSPDCVHSTEPPELPESPESAESTRAARSASAADGAEAAGPPDSPEKPRHVVAAR